MTAQHLGFAFDEIQCLRRQLAAANAEIALLRDAADGMLALAADLEVDDDHEAITAMKAALAARPGEPVR